MKIVQILLSALVLTLTACGGGGGGGGGAAQSSISGTATKGPMSNATVKAFAISSGQMGAQIGTTTTNANGNFTMSVTSFHGPVMLQVSGGSYPNEATGGTTMTMMPGDVMTAVLPTGATLSGVEVTPITAMAQMRAQQMSGGMTDANIAAANTAMGNYFNFTGSGGILYTQPMNPLATNSGTAAGVTQDMKNYGMVLAAMSQYANTLNMNTSDLVMAMMNDATDGVMNGMMSGSNNPIQMSMGGMMGSMPSTAGTSSLGAAMTSFIGTGANASGLTTTDMATLITKLNSSNGQI